MSLSLFLAWPGRAGDPSVVLPGDGASWSCVLTGDCFSCPTTLACGDETGWILAGLPGDDCCCVLGGDWLGKLTVVGIEGFGYVLVTVVTTLGEPITDQVLTQRILFVVLTSGWDNE